jgi:hypothetical protein
MTRRIAILTVEWHTRWYDRVVGHGVARIGDALVAFEATMKSGELCNPYGTETRNVRCDGVVQRRRRAMHYATRQRFAAALDECLAYEPPDVAALPTHQERRSAVITHIMGTYA